MITLYWHPRTRAARAMWMLEELGTPYDLETIDIYNPAERNRADFLACSPLSKVPAIADGDVNICDSATICMYLADKYGAGRLAPAIDDPRRADYLYWMIFTPGVIEPAMSEKAGGWEPNRHRNGWGDFSTMIETLERGVSEGPWLLGEQFTAADIMVGSSANFLKLFKMIDDNPAIDAYVERCLARPAYQKTLAKDAATEGHQPFEADGGGE